MAGIFSDVSTDIQKLRQLKAEIENVKKALKGINVNVDIDIAKGMEAQLKSLTAQYETLVRKVSEAEGKIMISTKRINDASEKIIKAQERLSQSANANPQSDNPVNKTGATSVEAQAKAYDELAREIDGVMGTRAQNIKRMIEEQNAIRLINEEIKKLIKFQTGTSTLTGTQQKRLEQLNNSLLTHKAALAEVRQTLMNNVRLDNAAATSMNGLSQSLSRMRIAYRELTEEERNSPFGKELLASIQLADAKIKKLDATIGNHQRNVGNYASTFNGLGMSVQQIVREFPAATMGLNMFFLAISNNLPILTDEIKRAIEMNKQLKAQNQATVPVWKQLISSLFSWQTALVVAITAMSMYGKEIISWIGNLFNAKEEVNALRQEHEALNNAMSNARAESAKEVAQLSVLYAMTQNTNASMQDRIAAVRQLQSQYPAYFGNLSQEAILAGQASAAYQQLTNDIMATAYARAYQNRIEKLAAENVEEIRGSRADFNYMRRNRASYNSARKYLDSERGIYAYSQYQLSQQNRDNVQIDYGAVAEYTQQLKIATEYEERRVRWQRHNTAYKQREVQMQEYENEVLKRQSALMKTTQGSLYTEDAKKAEREVERREKGYEKLSKESKAAQEELNKDLLSLQQQNQDDEIALLQDGTQKKLAEIKNDYQKRIAEINKQEAEFKAKNKAAGLTGLDADGITDEQAEALSKARDIAAKEKEREMQDLYSAEVEQMRSYLKEYGTYQQRKLAIAEEYAQKIQEAQNEGERLSLQASMDDALSKLDFEQIKGNMNWEDVFGNLGDMTISQLERIRQQLRNMLSDGNLGLEEYKTAVEQIDKINTAIVEKNDEVKNTLGLILPMTQRRKEIEMEVAEAERTVNSLMHEMMEMQNSLNQQRESVAGYLQTSGISVGAKDIITSNFDNILSQIGGLFGEDSDIYKNVKKSFDDIAGSERKLTTTTQKLVKAQNDEYGARTKLNNFLTSFGNKLQAISDIMSLINSNIQSLPDLFSQLGVDMSSDFGKGISDLANASQSASNFIKDAMSGNFVGALSNGIGAVKGILSGFNNILGLGIGKGNVEYVTELTEKLTDSNDRLRDSIDRLKDKMDESAGGEAIKNYEQAKDAQEQLNRQTLEILKAQMSYTGAHHSNAYYWGEAIDGNAATSSRIYDSINKSLIEWLKTNPNANYSISSVNSYEDMFKLTPEQMAYIRDYNREIWNEITDIGKYDKSEYWENYADLAGQLENLTEQINENLTQVSFDSLRDSFMNTLLDMDADAQDFADDFGEYMMKSLLNYQLGDVFDEDLKKWYDDWAQMMSGQNGNLTDDQMNELKDRWEDMVDEALSMRDSIADITGYKGGSEEQQSASSKGFETMSQNAADELNGRFTALYESNLRIETSEQQQTVAITELRGNISALTAQAVGIYNIADETRTILANSYLELQEIRENTGYSAKYLKDIKADIAEVKRNTSRL